MDLAEYEAIFDGAESGWGFEVERNGLSVRALKRRLGQAVKRQLGEHASLRYESTPEESGALAFQVRLPVPVTEDAPARRRSSRRPELSAAPQ
jgi:hypothetical protein